MTGPSLLILPNDTAWPNPSAVGDLEWRLRYTGTATRPDGMFAATVCSAYVEMIYLTVRRRETTVRLIKAATPVEDEERPSEPPTSLELLSRGATPVGTSLAAVLDQLQAEADEADRLSRIAGTPVLHASHASGIRMAVYRVRETLAGRAPEGGEWQ